MSTVNRDECVNTIKWAMITAGLWSREVSKNPILNKINYVYSVFARFIYLFFYVGIIIELIRLTVQKYTLSIILSSFTVVITATKISIIVAIYYKNNVLFLLDEATKKEAEVWAGDDNEVKQIFLEKVKKAKLFALLLWVSTFGTVTSTNVSGIFANNNLIKYNEANNVSVETHYLYQFWFPANKLDHLWIVTIISAIVGYGAMVYNIATNLIVVVLCIHSATHFSILQHRLRNYIPEDFDEKDMDKAIYTLTGLIFQHRYLIEFTEHVNKCCKYIIMMEFFLSSIDVASGALNIIKMNVSDLGWLIFYFPMLIIQIYCIAWSASEVMIQSQAVADAAYESRWYLLNKKGRLLTQTMIQRAHQRPLKMTIGPFGPMTMQSFLMIMKAAYSYVSIMMK